MSEPNVVENEPYIYQAFTEFFKSSLVSPSTTRTVFHHHLRMNKLLLLAFLVTLMAVLTLGSESQQVRQVSKKNGGKGNTNSAKKHKGSGRKNRKAKGKGRGRRGGNKIKNEDKKVNQRKGGKGNTKSNTEHAGPGRNNLVTKIGDATLECSANTTCLNNPMTYMKTMKDTLFCREEDLHDICFDTNM